MIMRQTSCSVVKLITVLQMFRPLYLHAVGLDLRLNEGFSVKNVFSVGLGSWLDLGYMSLVKSFEISTLMKR